MKRLHYHKCEKLKLRVSLRDYDHSFASSMFHLLRSCNSTRKISIKLDSGHLMVISMLLQMSPLLMAWFKATLVLSDFSDFLEVGG